MRKRGARLNKGLKSYLLLPEQVAIYVTPMHVAFELLPLGLFNRAHADHLAMIINLVAVDAAGSGNGMWQVADKAGNVLTAMHERTKEGKAWNTTAEERNILRECITKFDRYIRSWTSARLAVASVMVDDHNRKAKAKGGQFLERSPVEAD